MNRRKRTKSERNYAMETYPLTNFSIELNGELKNCKTGNCNKRVMEHNAAVITLIDLTLSSVLQTDFRCYRFWNANSRTIKQVLQPAIIFTCTTSDATLYTELV